MLFYSRRAASMLALSGLFFMSFPAFAGGPDLPLCHKHRGNVYIEIAMGQQGVHAGQESTALTGNDLIPFDRKDIMERVALGYSLIPNLNIETGLTFYSGYGYQVSSSQNNFNRSLLGFEFMLQPMVNWDRVHFYVMGGPVLVYSGVGKFRVADPETGEKQAIPANWPSTYYLRPEAGAGVMVDATSQIRLGAVFARLFGQGNFQSSFQDGQLGISKSYLPDVDYIAATVTFVF
jgi:hypothetical protein